jgi:hypothetical protein
MTVAERVDTDLVGYEILGLSLFGTLWKMFYNYYER